MKCYVKSSKCAALMAAWYSASTPDSLESRPRDFDCSSFSWPCTPPQEHTDKISKISQPKLWYAPHPRTAPNDDNDSQSKQSTAACMQTEACTALHNKQGFFNCAYYHLVTRHRALCLGSPASPANLMLILVHNRNCSGLTSDRSAQSRAACYMM